MPGGLSPINRAFNRIPKRAESRQVNQLYETFEDSGVAAALEAIDHQVLYGRRGTGKTHALRYVESRIRATGDVAVYVDLRTVGSPEGLFMGDDVPIGERAARLLVDLLAQLHDVLLQAALDDEDLLVDAQFVARLDAVLAAITSLRVSGEIETEREAERSRAQKDATGLSVAVNKGAPEVRVDATSDAERTDRGKLREKRTGVERLTLNFGDVARALRELANSLSERRIWLLLDEWSSVPPELQPYLAEFLVRTVLPLQRFTVKIAAIEQQSRFRVETIDGTVIGIELGADVAANLDLDEFMVFEQNEDRARSFFRGLLWKHLTHGVEDDEKVAGLATEDDIVRLGFTDTRAFDELVRAAEGVPRDAINIAAKAALQAGEVRISVPNVRTAARSWFQTDKEAALRSREVSSRLLNWIIDEVIRGKRARGFLVSQRSSAAPLLMALFDARVLHIVRRGYSAQDEPGERYDVYVIDYGAYVDLMRTKYEPEGTLPLDTGAFVDVPTQDLRAIRRAVLDLNAFEAQEVAASDTPR